MNAIVAGARSDETVKHGSVRRTPERAGTASPILSLIDHITSNQDTRHSWIFDAADQIREMNNREAQGLCIKCGGQEYRCECFPEGDY